MFCFSFLQGSICIFAKTACFFCENDNGREFRVKQGGQAPNIKEKQLNDNN